MQLRNQLIMAPVKLGYCRGDGQVNNRHLEFYRERATWLGAVTLEPLYLDSRLRELPSQLGIDSDDKIEGLRQLTNAIHEQGAKVIAHLNHPGRMTNPKLPGNIYLSSTDQACENGGQVPRPMSERDMAEVLNLFTDAVRRAEQADIDIIELQLGHGYLAAQFLSQAVNNRDGHYGGSFENRRRFPLALFDAVKAATRLPVIVRVSGEEMTPTGIKLDETIALAKLLEEKGAAAIHVSAGTVCSTPPWFFQHMFVPKGKTWEMAAAVKREVQIPVVFVGRVNSVRDLDRLRDDYQADFIALGRALVADPDFAGKYLNKVESRIRPCLACSEGCLGGVRSGKGLGCVVNPLVGSELERPTAAATSKKIAVVGAGLAGIEAALTLHARGHQVDLYEQQDVGGQFNLAWLPPNKESLREIVDYYRYELKQKQITLLRRKATAIDLLQNDYQDVVIATGAKPAIPPIDGLDKYFWAEFLLDENLPHQKNIVVIGGGLIGIEIASKLVEKENAVTIVEMLDEAARGMEMIEKTMTLKKLAAKRVPIHLNTRVVRIDGREVHLKGDHEGIIRDVDHLVIATGMRSDNELYRELEEKVPIHLIGDARQPGKAQDAIRDGYETGCRL